MEIRRWLAIGVGAVLVGSAAAAVVHDDEVESTNGRATARHRPGATPGGGEHLAAPPPERSVHAASSDRPVLHAFDDCASLDRHVRDQAQAAVTEWGLPYQPVGGPVAVAVAGTGASASAGSGEASADAAAPAAGFSTTNVQEAGVDEPDIVKNDDRRAFTLFDGVLRAVTVDGERGTVSDELDLDAPTGAELLLVDDRLVVLSSTDSSATHIVVVDATSLEVVRRLEVEGSYVSARQVGDTVRLVVTQNGPAFPFVTPSSSDAAAIADALAHNRAAIAGAELAEWLPDLSVDGVRRHVPVTGCDTVFTPASFSGPGSTTVVTFSPGDATVRDATSVLATAGEVYATADRLYVTTEVWDIDLVEPVTEVHRFDVRDPERSRYEGSGAVPGRLLRPPWFVGESNLGQWALSEHDGDLRIATTVEAVDAPAASGVTVLRLVDDALVPIGHVGGLGVGEQLYAVRFMGPIAYVVTYVKVDPLYVVDLHDPTAPRVAGELKATGYSAYLHPVADGRLLGLGQADDDADGFADGSHVGLFDVHDLTRPALLDVLRIGDRGSLAGAEADHRTFTWWPETGRAVVTVTDFEDPTRFQGAVVLEIGGDRVLELGRVQHRVDGAPCATPIARSRVVGTSLLTFSAVGVGIDALDDVTPRDFVDYGTGAGDPRCPSSPPPSTTTTTTTVVPLIGA